MSNNERITKTYTIKCPILLFLINFCEFFFPKGNLGDQEDYINNHIGDMFEDIKNAKKEDMGKKQEKQIVYRTCGYIIVTICTHYCPMLIPLLSTWEQAMHLCLQHNKR